MSLRTDLEEAANILDDEECFDMASALRAHATADYEGRLARAVELLKLFIDDDDVPCRYIRNGECRNGTFGCAGCRARAFLSEERTREGK